MSRVLVDSGIKWIGSLPSTWSITTVNKIFYRRKEVNDVENPTVLSLARDGVKIRDISTNEGQLAESYDNYHKVYKDDLMINPMDLISGANCSLSEVEGVISPAYINLAKKENIYPKYYDYFFKYQYWIKAMFIHGKGVSFDNRWTMNWETMSSYKLPLPRYDEQRKIAKYLDNKCFKIDGIINDNNHEINLLNDYKNALITNIIINGINETEYSSYDFFIKKIPKSYKIIKFKYLLEDKVDNRGRTPELSMNNNDIPLIELDSIGKKNPNLESCKKFISQESHDIYIRKDLKEGDILFATVGATIGKTSIVGPNPNYCIAQNLVGYRFSKDNYPLFWYYYFKSKIFDYTYKRYDKSNTINNVKISNLEQASMLVPTYNCQKEIANYLDRQCSKIDEVIEYRKQIIEKLEEYKKSLIYEYVTGKREV